MPERLDGSVAHKPGVAFVSGEERAVLLDLDRPGEPPVVLEGSGQMMWSLLASATTVDELVDDVAAYYDEAADAVRPAVVTFVLDLLDRGLLVRS